MLFHSKLVKKDVVLWTDANDLLDELDILLQFLGCLSIVNQVFAETSHKATRCFHHAGEH
jgi:hypothetical protein